MELEKRRYQGEADFWRICGFLRELFLLNDRLYASVGFTEYKLCERWIKKW